ncbi:MAG TPA: response regulator, partial [Flavobacterium sp.]|nr:response regulator [Flavobacterium sp.]
MEKQYNVVLADDDADDRDLFVELLSQPNVNVNTVINGTELLDYLSKRTDDLPDCIFLDLNMPVLGGKECLQQIRATEKLKDIPVIIYSTSSNRKDIEDTFSMGANLYVVKANSYIVMKNIL